MSRWSFDGDVLVGLDPELLVGGAREPDVVAALLESAAAALMRAPVSPTDVTSQLSRSLVVRYAEDLAEQIRGEAERVSEQRKGRAGEQRKADRRAARKATMAAIPASTP